MEKPIIILVHGWGGSPQTDFFPWLRAELEKEGFTTISPTFPDTDEPDLNEWTSILKKNVRNPSNTILVGHSFGVPTALKYASEHNTIQGIFLVAGGHRPGFHINYDPILSIPHRLLIVSDDDPIISLQSSQELAHLIDAQLIIEHGMKHFGDEDGITTIPTLLLQIRKTFSGKIQ